VIATVALGTAAPLASLTWPTIALVVSPWVKAASGNRKRNDPIRTNMQEFFRSMVVDPVPFDWTVSVINLT
jgi:hypothetical protein